MTDHDWVAWHEPYDDAGSPLHRRLQAVQHHLRGALAAVPPGRVRVVSICAGQGRDLLGVLDGHPRRDDVVARLVELDERNADRARQAARAAGLDGVEVVTGDASRSDAYAGAVPADVVLACGVFGNVADADVRGTIAFLPQLCAPAATVVWTRHRNPPDLTLTIRGWFDECGFDEIAFDAPGDAFFGVGVHRLRISPPPLRAGVRVFEFVGFDARSG
ncbi:MAG TPA: class I SAM-dependent methyltransferase family protein [Acidimicrobiia bacterium]